MQMAWKLPDHLPGALLTLNPASQPFANHGRELFEMHGFADVIGGPGCQALFAVADHGQGGQRDNGGLGKARIGAQAADGFQPAHDRHLEAGQTLQPFQFRGFWGGSTQAKKAQNMVANNTVTDYLLLAVDVTLLS